MRADQPNLAVAEIGVRLAECHASVAQRLHLGSRQLEACLVAVEQVVVMPRPAVLGVWLDAGGLSHADESRRRGTRDVGRPLQRCTGPALPPTSVNRTGRLS